MPNRLAAATSPYLLQHQDNPVDWWEWEADAFAEARRRDVPILLSVGYAACHWCHVMAHESFEDPATAKVMNSGFVNVKVDREERPDVDAVYMDAVTAMTGHGGWPMTAFLTADGAPFYAGTYFPPTPRPGMPSFRQLLEAVSATWRDRRGEVVGQGREIVRQLSQGRAPSGSDGPPTEEDLAAAVSALDRDLDRRHGGFGGAPKFPPAMVCEFLLRTAARTGNAAAAGMADRTLEAMARGGMYDQLAGGFARYSVDAAWVVPHFEKMLYDNALLLRVYLHAWRATGSALCERVVRETAEFLLFALRTPEGGFAASLDADTEGVEGLTYVWTPQQLRDVLGDRDGAWAAELLVVTDDGTFEHGSSTLQLPRDPDDSDRWPDLRMRLLAARDERPQPGRDDKVVAAWNGLAVAALAEAGALLDEPSWVDAAAAAAELLLRVHLDEHGRLRRTSRQGLAGRHAGVLEDYADVAEGLLALTQVTGDAAWLSAAQRLLDVLLERFTSIDAAGTRQFWDTADDAEQLIRRPQDSTDNVTPSGQHAAAGALLTLAALTGSARHREAAQAALGTATLLAGRAPRFAGWGLAVAEALVAGPAEVAVVGPAHDAATVALRRAAFGSTSPGSVTVSGDPADPRSGDQPLLRDRPLVAGHPAAYVCRGFVCEAPVTDPGALLEQLRAGATRSLWASTAGEYATE